MIRSRGVQNITHYIDDFIVVGLPDSPQCTTDLETTYLRAQTSGSLLFLPKQKVHPHA